MTTHNGWCFVDDELVKRIKKIVDATGAQIVLSSTWRLGWIKPGDDPERYSAYEVEEDFIELRKKFNEFGMDFYDKTPYSIKYKNRGDEIGAWLKNRKSVEKHLILGDEVDAWLNDGDDNGEYLILDDMPDLGEYMDHLLYVNFMTGITEADVQVASDFLNGKIGTKELHDYCWEV